MGISWKDTKQARAKNRGPLKTKRVVRLRLEKGIILDGSRNEYSIREVRELILTNLAITEDENLLDLLERGEN